MRPLPTLLLLAATLAVSPAARAQEAATPPAPPEESAMCTDRPTKVFATCVVDTGRLQLETDLFNGTFLRLGGVTTDTWLVTNPTLKYGLAKNLDIEANLAPYVVVRTHDKFGDGSTIGGVGDLYLRAKAALYSGSKLSVSVTPYIKAPIARSGIGNGEVEGGGAVAIGYKLTDEWTLALSPEVDAYADASGGGRHVNHIEVINLGRSLPHDVTVSAELWGDWNYDPAGTIRQYSADVAVAWLMHKDLQLDAGLNFGLNKYTPGVQAYVGVSHRF